jgi:hypothetical protein
MWAICRVSVVPTDLKEGVFPSATEVHRPNHVRLEKAGEPRLNGDAMTLLTCGGVFGWEIGASLLNAELVCSCVSHIPGIEEGLAVTLWSCAVVAAGVVSVQTLGPR